MSSLWTPEGEHRIEAERGRPTPAAAPGPTEDEGELDEAALAAHLDELRQQLAGTPAEVVVANHAFGLFELAALHLSQQPPNLEAARLAVDAMGALVEGLAGRLGEGEEPLTGALAQIRMAYVQITGAARAAGVLSARFGLVTAGGPESARASSRPRCPGAAVKTTRVPTAMVRLPSAMAVQWNG